ncbi:SWIM-type domain-containing protein [Mycena venus]|uniref:SWIM-type domain-containing protein n=1 Tax=Mycena venus TaxID=2733690 RepID=A0A8H6YPZ2_9AGAR|nr:SWIM-type domain-containing protein [Mycena venus]
MSQSPVSDSPALHRTQRTPSRHSPYRRGPIGRSSHGGGENFRSMGPGHPGDFDTQYPAYNSSSSSGYGMPFAPVHNFESSRRLPALTTVVNIDEISTEYGLDSAQRKSAHNFAKLTSEDHAVTLFLRLLRMEKQNNNFEEKLEAIETHMKTIGAYCMESWKPSKQQHKLLKSLLKHYMIRPITSYNNLVPIVETYVYDHAKQLRLELYKQDPTVKTVVNEVIAMENGNVRSAIRKAVWTSVKEKTDLETFSKKIVGGYHLPTKPTNPPKDIMACLALMRKIARPLAKKENTRGADTGFWTNLEGELDVLFDKNGNDRSNPKWREWEQAIINEDNAVYLRRAPESNARTQEEIDATLLAASGSIDPAATGSAPPEDEEDGDGNTVEERDVNISSPR